MVSKKAVYRGVLWVLTLACAAMILSLSLQPAGDSSALSSGLTHRVLCWFSAYRDLPAAEQATVLAYVQTLVREAAHVAEFTLLGLFASLLSGSYVGRRFWRVSIIFTALFAVVDECAQEFLASGRAFQLIDLAKDWLGCALGTAMVWLLLYIKQKTEKRT